MTWVYPVLGMMEEVPSATKDAQAPNKNQLPAVLVFEMAGCINSIDAFTVTYHIIICTIIVYSISGIHK